MSRTYGTECPRKPRPHVVSAPQNVHAHGQLARGIVLVQMVFDVVVLAAAATTLTTRVKQTAASRAASRRESR